MTDIYKPLSLSSARKTLDGMFNEQLLRDAGWESGYDSDTTVESNKSLSYTARALKMSTKMVLFPLVLWR